MLKKTNLTSLLILQFINVHQKMEEAADCPTQKCIANKLVPCGTDS